MLHCLYSNKNFEIFRNHLWIVVIIISVYNYVFLRLILIKKIGVENMIYCQESYNWLLTPSTKYLSTACIRTLQLLKPLFLFNCLQFCFAYSRFFFNLGGVKVFHSTYWCIISDLYWKINASSHVMAFVSKSGSSVSRFMMSEQIFFHLSGLRFFDTIFAHTFVLFNSLCKFCFAVSLFINSVIIRWSYVGLPSHF